MPDSSSSPRAGDGIGDAWSELLKLWRPFIPNLPALAPSSLDQNILASLIGGGQFSLLSTTVNQQATQAPELEEEIVSKVASYGKQIGRLMDAVGVLTRHLDVAHLTDDDRLALGELATLADDIAVARKRFAHDNVEVILKSISRLARPDHVDHDALQRIRDLVDRLDRQD